MDRFESMSVFVAAVEAGSLSGAARSLRMPLATVSRKVSELERHLGARVLVRTTRRLSLTDAGRDYHASCRRLLEELGESERAVRGEYAAPRGELVVTAPVVFGRMHLLPLVAEFLGEYPEVDVRLLLADRVVNLVEERVDVAVRMGELPDSSLLSVRVGSLSTVVCASPAYLRASGAPRTPEDLRRHACITFEGISPSSSWTFRGGKRAQTVRVHSRLSVSTAEAAIDAARFGLGLTRVLSYQVEESEREGKLVRVLRKFEGEPQPISVVHSGRALLPRKVRAFLDFVTPRLARRMSHTPR